MTTMGNPTQGGGKVHAASAAQIPDKTFPAGTDPGEVAGVQASALAADTGWRGQSASGPQPAGTPVQPEIRQVTPVAEMGMGYREGSEDDPC
jgi:hypothetical protein